jgi:trehalose 6-phosphate synthase
VASAGGSDGAEPLIVVSNRLPFTFPPPGSDERPSRTVGGLVSALEPVLARNHGTWVGWDGIAANGTAGGKSNNRELVTENGIRVLGVPLTQHEFERYYHGFSNRSLWPLFHGLVDTTYFRPEYFTAYVDANRRFAEATFRMIGPGSRIWVHDYHLLLVPSMLREMGFDGRIDFFLHIPFPPPEIFRALPWRGPLLDGMLAADAVVFHVEPYRDNFVALTTDLFGSIPSSADEHGHVAVHHRKGRTVVAAEPIGIDVEAFESLSRKPEVRGEAERIRATHDDRKILIGADRLDYTKGILERLRSVERLLDTRPEFAGAFHLSQVVVPSRHEVQEYRELKQRLDREVGRINGRFARSGWIPLHYEFRALSREELVARYLSAHAALVTPLKDGMNLVASEFVASRTDERGVLILSEFAGISRALDHALIVNPYDVDGCADAIELALRLSPEEQQRRMRRLRERVLRNPVSDWARRCLEIGTPRTQEMLSSGEDRPR